LKISICGKGGTGKSTLVAVLANEFLRRGAKVIVVDSDESNSGLHNMLGLDRRPNPLMELAGGRKNVRQALRSGPAKGTQEKKETSVLAQAAIRVDDLPEKYVCSREGLRLVAVGKIHHALEGCACPIGVLSREFLKRMVLAEGEIAIVDMEAGIEHFGRGVETSIDCVVAVVEPSLESVNLAEKVNSLADASGALFAGAIINKTTSRTMAGKIETALRDCGIKLLGVMRFHPEFLDAALEGQPLPSGVAEDEIRTIADAIVSISPLTESRIHRTEESVMTLEEKITDLKARMPAHSVNPSMVQELEELEERLKTARGKSKRR
jgi:CO dehydrogenase maturation factor